MRNIDINKMIYENAVINGVRLSDMELVKISGGEYEKVWEFLMDTCETAAQTFGFNTMVNVYFDVFSEYENKYFITGFSFAPGLQENLAETWQGKRVVTMSLLRLAGMLQDIEKVIHKCPPKAW